MSQGGANWLELEWTDEIFQQDHVSNAIIAARAKVRST